MTREFADISIGVARLCSWLRVVECVALALQRVLASSFSAAMVVAVVLKKERFAEHFTRMTDRRFPDRVSARMGLLTMRMNTLHHTDGVIAIAVLIDEISSNTLRNSSIDFLILVADR